MARLWVRSTLRSFLTLPGVPNAGAGAVTGEVVGAGTGPGTGAGTVSVTGSGVVGWAGVKGELGAEGAEVPWALVAVTVTVKLVPLVRPAIVHELVVLVHDAPPGAAVAV